MEAFVFVIFIEFIWYGLKYCFLWLKYRDRKLVNERLAAIHDEEISGNRRTIGTIVFQVFTVIMLVLLSGGLLLVLCRVIFNGDWSLR